MYIHRKFIVALLLSASSLSPAATEFDTAVPVNLVRYMTGGSAAYRDLPDNFPRFVMPDGLLVIGAQDSPFQQLVLLRTSRSGAESQAAVAEALMAEGGWLTLAPAGSPRQNGFVVPAVAPQPVSLCHDEFGELEIRGEDGIENRVYIKRFNRAVQENWQGCAVLNEARQGRPPQMDAENSLYQYMPSFAFLVEDQNGTFNNQPEAGIRGAQVLPTPSSGIQGLGPPLSAPTLGIRGVPFGIISNSIVDLEPNLSIPATNRSTEDVNDLVIEQLREEGWELDAKWEGVTGAGSNWSRTPETSMKLFLSFAVMETGTQDYEVEIKLTELEQTGD